MEMADQASSGDKLVTVYLPDNQVYLLHGLLGLQDVDNMINVQFKNSLCISSYYNSWRKWRSSPAVVNLVIEKKMKLLGDFFWFGSMVEFQLTFGTSFV